ncbi:MAG TPA: YciI family protein [Gaiella sp.]|nr:YciI family protein [Gaiella sp.]
MKYLLQIYPHFDPEEFAQLAEEEQDAIVDEYLAVSQSPGVVGGAQLQPADTATTVRVADGETLLTDGPFMDAKEHVGGFLLVEADDLDLALELAARIPAARMGGAVEVRPLVERAEA